MTDKQAQKAIDAKLAQAEVLLAEAAQIAEENGVEFSYGFEGMGDGSYIPKRVAWDSSTAGCLKAEGHSRKEILEELRADGLVGWVSSSARC